MRYRSTRSHQHSSDDFTFEDCILKGIAPDGGLLLPEHFPEISLTTLESWQQEPLSSEYLSTSTCRYQDVVFQVCKLYVDHAEIPHSELKTLIDNAFEGFSLPEIARCVPVRHLDCNRPTTLQVAELFHGPTMAFKDLSVSGFASFLRYFLKKNKKCATIIVATSGDTGGSVIHAFKGMDSIDVVVMYPIGRCNEIQELQMTTVADENIHCFAVEGTSDDEDSVMADILNDESFSLRHNITVANSINWGRLLIQVANYFYIYLKSGITIGETLSIVVPTGGAGNVTGGCIARKMGLPVEFTVAVNANDCLHRFIQNGVLKTSDEVNKTLASAMDIQVPYNVERLLSIYCLDTLITEDIQTLIKNFFNDGHEVKVSDALLEKLKEVIVDSYSADDKEILETIRHCWAESEYAICPHTATALASFYKREVHRTKMTVCIATASPYKFPEVLREAGIPCNQAEEILQQLRGVPVRNVDSMVRGSENWAAQMRLKIETITELRERK